MVIKMERTNMNDLNTKKRYAAPQLAVHGKVTQLTAGGSGVLAENNGNMTADRNRV